MGVVDRADGAVLTLFCVKLGAGCCRGNGERAGPLQTAAGPANARRRGARQRHKTPDEIATAVLAQVEPD